METMALIILLAGLALAGGAAYWFLQWKCLTIKEKIVQLVEEQGEEIDDINELEDATPAKIKEGKNKIAKAVKEAKQLQKKNPEELSEQEQEALDKLPTLEEIQSLTQKLETKEDLNKKVYGTWDYVYGGGVAVVVFGITWSIGNLIAKKVKGENV